MRHFIDLVENTFTQYPGSLVYDDWTDFATRLKAALAQSSSERDFCEKLGISFELYEKVVTSALEKWRESTSMSMLHGVGHLDDIPSAGTQIFPDILWQTRFLRLSTGLVPLATKRIRDPKADGKPDAFGRINLLLKVRNEYALTTDDTKTVNDLLRIVYAYRAYTTARPVKKLPKLIYRGIRVNDLWNHVDLKTLVDQVWKRDASHEMKRKEAIDIVIAFIIKHGMNTISDGRMLSFTASKPVANYFANKDGFIIQLDPRLVEVVTSELHDAERVAGVDDVSGRNEREYIVRIPSSFKWSRDNFIIADTDYLIAEQNPLAVAYFNHNNREASYDMNGVKITARYHWRTNTAGSLYFTANDHYVGSKKDFKDAFGFDPVPTEKNLDQISNFKIVSVKTY